jgi:hypothetical protein
MLHPSENNLPQTSTTHFFCRNYIFLRLSLQFKIQNNLSTTSVIRLRPQSIKASLACTGSSACTHSSACSLSEGCSRLACSPRQELHGRPLHLHHAAVCPGLLRFCRSTSTIASSTSSASDSLQAQGEKVCLASIKQPASSYTFIHDGNFHFPYL